jgi:hypothetical protein
LAHIETADPAGGARLLRCCARPPFALERLQELDPELLLHGVAKLSRAGKACFF